ncbi:MAG: DUF1877 family protein [Candidatus Methanoplasma sp.]|jgi:hypothetical protein|nr:DUF1877 family protein [Candidatus Methanoplasma sp.]
MICAPAVFKTRKEVEEICARLEPLTPKEFSERVSVRKLVKAGWMDKADRREAMKQIEDTADALLNEFFALREAYRMAANGRKGMLIV